MKQDLILLALLTLLAYAMVVLVVDVVFWVTH